MHTSAKLGLAVLTVTLLLSVAINTASARNLSFNTQTMRSTWSSLEFQNEFETVRCQVTLEGSFHSSTIVKVRGSLIGALYRIRIKREGCVTGRIDSIGLPWHLTYEGFTGTLPDIMSLQLLVSRFLILRIGSIFSNTCSYGMATDNLTFSATRDATGALTNLVPVAGRNIANVLEGDPGCASRITVFGVLNDGILRVQNSTTKITLTLI